MKGEMHLDVFTKTLIGLVQEVLDGSFDNGWLVCPDGHIKLATPYGDN